MYSGFQITCLKKFQSTFLNQENIKARIFYLPNDLNNPISIGTRIRHALFASTLTTSELVVIVFTMSMLFILFELFKLLMTSLISLNCEFSIL